MVEGASRERRRVLDPVDRLAEVLFGLIMALTFTGSLSAAESGREDVRTMLIGALGCNIAWGIVDAVMYLLAALTERGADLRHLRAVQGASDAAEARRLLAERLPPAVEGVVRPEDLDHVRDVYLRLTHLPDRARLHRDDVLGAVGVFLLVVLATFPVVIPFLLFREDAVLALRVSNAIAIAMLFATGYAYGRHAGIRPRAVGLSMVLVGSVLVAVTIALGG